MHRLQIYMQFVSHLICISVSITVYFGLCPVLFGLLAEWPIGHILIGLFGHWAAIGLSLLSYSSCLVCLRWTVNKCSKRCSHEPTSDRRIEEPSAPPLPQQSNLTPLSLPSRNYNETNTTSGRFQANLYDECPRPDSTYIPSAPERPNIYYTEDFKVVISHKSEKATTSVAEKEEESCVVCFGGMNPRCRLFPCGHASFCVECGLKVGNQNLPKCPLCRTEIIAVTSERSPIGKTWKSIFLWKFPFYD